MQHARNLLARRIARAHRGMTLLEIMIVLAILAIVMGIIVGPRVIEAFRDSKVKTTRIKLRMLAFQAYPTWSASHPDKDCPDRLAELAPYMNHESLEDAWGAPIKMVCGASAPVGSGGFAVLSTGPDRQVGTPDDLRSWD